MRVGICCHNRSGILENVSRDRKALQYYNVIIISYDLFTYNMDFANIITSLINTFIVELKWSYCDYAMAAASHNRMLTLLLL